MDLGAKIKNARISSNFTQEQTAEALGVSRQTVSNWENNKTYPDIVSVVKMSDLYDISLDHLLKEEKPVSDYLNYLEESTNIVKSKNKNAKLILIMTYLGIWAISLIVFWWFASSSDALGYSVMFLVILLPITTFVLSLIIGKNNYWGKLKWASAVVFGFMYMLADYSTFSVAHMLATNRRRPPTFEMFPVGIVIALIGLGIGAVINHYKNVACQATK